MALELGPAQVKWGESGSEADLGKTQGGISLTISESSQDLNSDQYGEAAEDTILTGTTVEVECPFAEVGHELLAKILLQDQINGTNGVVGENKVGTSLKAQGKSLLLIKYVNGAPSTDPADVMHFPCAAPLPNIELSYDATNQRVATATFKCFPISVTANWGSSTESAKVVSYWFGDETDTGA